MDKGWAASPVGADSVRTWDDEADTALTEGAGSGRDSGEGEEEMAGAGASASAWDGEAWTDSGLPVLVDARGRTATDERREDQERLTTGREDTEETRRGGGTATETDLSAVTGGSGTVTRGDAGERAGAATGGSGTTTVDVC